MKRFVAFLIAITVLFAFSAFAQAKPAAAKMKTCSAKVTAISESMVKADRIVKGKTEVFECTFDLSSFILAHETVVDMETEDTFFAECIIEECKRHGGIHTARYEEKYVPVANLPAYFFHFFLDVMFHRPVFLDTAQLDEIC